MTESSPRVHVNTATLLMGPTGSGKTTLLATLALWVWLIHHKTSLFYTTDGGGWPDLMSAMISRGIVRVWRLRTRSGYRQDLGFETCYRACEGYWPSRINPKTGESEPDAVLLPPVVSSYHIISPDGEILAEVDRQEEVAVAMQKLPNPNSLRTERITRPTKGLEDVGARFYDGLTSMSSWWEDQLAERQGKRELLGEKSAIGGIVVSGGIAIGGGNRAHVGFSQKRANQMVNLSLGIPGLVVPPFFTALTNDASDDRGYPICGPKFSGNAKTDEGPSWFGNCLEAYKGIWPGTNNTPRYELRTAEFYGIGDNRKHLCKTRADVAAAIPPILHDVGDAQGEVAEPDRYKTFSLGHFMTLLLAAEEKAEAWVDAQVADAPGLPPTELEDTAAAAQGTSRVKAAPAGGVGVIAGGIGAAVPVVTGAVPAIRSLAAPVPPPPPLGVPTVRDRAVTTSAPPPAPPPPAPASVAASAAPAAPPLTPSTAAVPVPPPGVRPKIPALKAPAVAPVVPQG